MLPLNYTVGLRVYERLRNARRTPNSSQPPRAHSRQQVCRGIAYAPIQTAALEVCSSPRVGAFTGEPSRIARSTRSGKPAGKFARVDAAQAVPNDDDPIRGSCDSLCAAPFSSRGQRVNRAIHVAPNAGEKGSVAELAQSDRRAGSELRSPAPKPGISRTPRRP